MSSQTLNLVRFATDFLSFTARQQIFAEGQPGDVMFIVREGEVDVVVHGAVVETLGPGGILGEMALIDPNPPQRVSGRQDGLPTCPDQRDAFPVLGPANALFCHRSDARTRQAAAAHGHPGVSAAAVEPSGPRLDASVATPVAVFDERQM
jgi:CRP-like cAMP-binding protein